MYTIGAEQKYVPRLQSDPLVVDSDKAGWYLFLAEVDGSGAISYYSSGSLKYAHLQVEQHTVYLPLVIK